MQKIYNKFRKHRILIFSLLFLLLFSGALQVFAIPPLTPYVPGDAELNPNCIPGSENCYVAVGTVTSVSITTANGVSGVVATGTTTPAVTLTLGAITPTSVNGLTLVTVANGFTIAGGTTPYTLTVPLDASVSGTNTGDQALGGSDTMVQFNDGGVFGGDANFTWDKTGHFLKAGILANTQIGTNAGASLVTGDRNIIIGEGAGRLVTGDEQTIIGYQAGYTLSALNDPTSPNTLIGYQAGYLSDINSGNTFLGYKAGYTSSGASAIDNVMIGSWAGYSNTSGMDNVVLGNSALYENTTGSFNFALGTDALANNISGNYNVAIGMGALTGNVLDYNVGIGGDASNWNTGANNTALGYRAGFGGAGSNYSDSTFIGYKAGFSTLTGQTNTAIGENALYTNATGSGNVALGYKAGQYETGSNAFYVDNQNRINTAGDKAGALLYGVFNANPALQTLKVNATLTANNLSGDNTGDNATNLSAWNLTGNAGTVDGTDFVGTTDNIPFNIRVNNQKAGRIDPTLLNTFFGYLAGNSNPTGIDNVGIGQQSLYSNTSGIENTAVGVKALFLNTEGNRNAAFGTHALYNNTTGIDNVGIGGGALYSNNIGDNNIAVGTHVLSYNTSGNNNTGTGHYALYNNTIASSNVADGYNALYNNTAAGSNIGIGYKALFTQSYNNGGIAWNTDNVAIGTEALLANNPTANNNGWRNTAVGNYTLRANTTGFYNTANGFYALYSNLTGAYNTAVGNSSLTLNTTGNYNTALGDRALYSNTTASRNIAVGQSALYTQSYNNGGTAWNSDNVAIGYGALYSNQPTSTTTGYQNTALGKDALYSNTTGSTNTALGYKAGYTNSTGAGNIFLGYMAGYYETGSNAFYVDNQDRTNTAGDKAKALLYGVFNATPASQTLTINAKVGIGTTSPDSPLHVVGTSSIAKFSNATTALYLKSGNIGTELGLTDHRDQVIAASDDTTAAKFHFADDAIAVLNGNVGIGTTTPLLRLDVAGSGRFTGTATSELTGDIDPDGTTTVTGVGTLFLTELVVGDRITVSAETRTVTAIATDLSLTVDTAFTDNANDTTPDKLPAIFLARTSAGVLKTAINDLGNVYMYGLSSGTGGAGYDAVCIDATTNEITINTNGTDCVVSSQRFKENISNLDLGLSFINSLQPRAFNYIDSDEPRVGFIAEEIEKLDKRLVFYEDDGITPRGVRYQEMTAVLAKSVQELDLKINDLANIDTPLVDEENNKTFVGRFFDRLVAWFGNVENGIEDFYTNRMRTKEICVSDESGETCITKTQLDALLAGAGSSGSSSGSDTPVPETCSDGIQNQDETDIDIGGVCTLPETPPDETCSDGIMNQDEIDIDIGGVCGTPPVPETCSDEIQNQDETGIDTGGICTLPAE